MNTQDLFFKLLRYHSLTPKDDGAFEFITTYLDDFTAQRIDIGGVKNLFLYKKFGEGDRLCFAGHIDVVPAGEGWLSDPFEPILKDGFVYARGTQDMKSGVCAMLQACKNTKNFHGTLCLILTSDEEGDGKCGTIEVLRYLETQNFLPHFAIVAEPTSETIFGDAIKIGRRGSINGVLEVFGLQGHAAYPAKAKNPIHLFASRLAMLAGYDFDDGDANFEPSKLVITDLRSGMEVTNVTPNTLKMMFNVRNSTKTSKKDIEAYIQKVCDGLDFRLTLSQSALPFVTSSKNKIVRKLCQSIEKVLTCKPKKSTAGGTSDARFMASFGVHVVEFGVRNDTIHAPNERCSLQEVYDLEKVFTDLIKNF
ncbi:MAG: succinyl-diaminopimelate desuccinylase [Sulfurospirillum sp.]|nr:succinyl-diaminopimelate desuccinylase [Sulfurospirillum sp.]